MNGPALLVPPRVPAWLAERDPRLRVVAALSWALVVLSLSRPSVLLLALGAALALALGAGFRPRELAWRLVALEGFMLVLLLSLPFTVPGDNGFSLGPLTGSWAGLERGAVILLKANGVLLGLLALVGSLEAVILGHALARLGLSPKLVHLFLFTVRYLGVLHTEYGRLRQALRARAFVARADRHSWRTLGWLLGMLLVHSLERARRIQDAMCCRGFQGHFYLLENPSWRGADHAWTGVLGLLLAGLLILEHRP